MTLATMLGRGFKSSEVAGGVTGLRITCECETEATTYKALEHEILFESANIEAEHCGSTSSDIYKARQRKKKIRRYSNNI